MHPVCTIPLVFCGLVIGSANASSQNAVVQWSAFDAGFERSVSAGSRLTGVTGLPFVGPTRQGTLAISVGFLAGAQVEGVFTSVGEHAARPATFALLQNYPNPFNPSTKIQFTIANGQLTTLKVYDILGREVSTLVNEVKQPGTYAVQFDARGLASGMYIYRIVAGSFTDQRKLLVLK